MSANFLSIQKNKLEQLIIMRQKGERKRGRDRDRMMLFAKATKLFEEHETNSEQEFSTCLFKETFYPGGSFA